MRKINRQRINEKLFDSHRETLSKAFVNQRSFFKRKLTQGMFWLGPDSNIANQYIHDEVWFLGMKIKDDLRFIDHGNKTEDDKKKVDDKKVGFFKQ